MDFLNIDKIFFQALGYDMSYLEFFGVMSGLVAVWLSAKANIWSWPIGIINVILAFFLYYQIQLYPDMFLQIFFLITNVIGWWRWLNPKPGEEDLKQQLKISFLARKAFLLLLLLSVAGTLLVGFFSSRLHTYFPQIFQLPSAYPYVDSFITVMSITATFLMIQKKIECWIIWIIIDVVATGLYFVKGIKFYSVEYLIFTGLAAFGLWHWLLEYRQYKTRVA